MLLIALLLCDYSHNYNYNDLQNHHNNAHNEELLSIVLHLGGEESHIDQLIDHDVED